MENITDTNRTGSTPTAVRVLRWPNEPMDCAGQRAGITVTFADGTTRKISGARAKRAAAVLITDQAGGPPKVRCRADYDAAVREAHRLSTATTMTGRFGTSTRQTIPVTPEPTVAIRVTGA